MPAGPAPISLPRPLFAAQVYFDITIDDKPAGRIVMGLVSCLSCSPARPHPLAPQPRPGRQRMGWADAFVLYQPPRPGMCNLTHIAAPLVHSSNLNRSTIARAVWRHRAQDCGELRELGRG